MHYFFFSNRCFPGLFKEKKVKRAKRAEVKTTPVTFFLLDKPIEKSPKHSEELTLLQAGLGKKTVQLPEDANHKEVLLWALSSKLCCAYLIHCTIKTRVVEWSSYNRKVGGLIPAFPTEHTVLSLGKKERATYLTGLGTGTD